MSAVEKQSCHDQEKLCYPLLRLCATGCASLWLRSCGRHCNVDFLKTIRWSIHRELQEEVLNGQASKSQQAEDLRRPRKRQRTLEPISETRYSLGSALDADLIGAWVTVAGAVDDSRIDAVEVASVEKSSGKTTRARYASRHRFNLPAEANGAGAYLYQEKKGRYFLLSSGAVDEPIQGDFADLVGQEVKVAGEYGSASYILYNAKVSAK
ncbi:MAG: hypothetical protein R2873_06620 [Caldilineaceae bacterium]